MWTEFQKDDLVAEIGDNSPGCYLVRDVDEKCYYFDVVVKGKRRMTCAWSPIEEAHGRFVKIGRWDGEKEIGDDRGIQEG